MFGFAVFAKNWRLKLTGILACCLVVGENVLLLVPLWALGAALYLYRERLALAPRPAFAGLVVSAALTGLLVCFLPEYPAHVANAPLFYSGSYLSNYLVGAGMGATIWFFARATPRLTVAPVVENMIRRAANHTFSLYLFHLPLIYFVQAMGLFDPHIVWQTLLAIAAILGVILGLSELTETKRKFLQRALLRIRSRRAFTLPEPAGS